MGSVSVCTEGRGCKVTKEEILNSENLKRRFAKDTRIPLTLYRNPYFEDRINLYNRSGMFGNILYKWNRYCEMLSEFKSEQDYFEHYGEVKDGIIDTIKGSEAYDRFNTMDMNPFGVSTNLPKKDLFKPSFSGRYFVSIDMKQANFAALHKYDPAMFNGFDTWEEFVGQFTTYNHIIESKYIREATLGNCNPKRHITYERWLMSIFLGEFTMYGNTLGYRWEDNIVFFSNDEVVFDVTDMDSTEVKILKTSVDVNMGLLRPIEMHVNHFRLVYIPEIDGYIEIDTETKKLTPKAVNSYMLPFLCCKLMDKEPTDSDMVFEHPNVKGVLARFLGAPEFELPEEIMK